MALEQEHFILDMLAAWGDGRAPGLNPICTTPPQ